MIFYVLFINGQFLELGIKVNYNSGYTNNRNKHLTQFTGKVKRVVFAKRELLVITGILLKFHLVKVYNQQSYFEMQAYILWYKMFSVWFYLNLGVVLSVTRGKFHSAILILLFLFCEK